MIAWWVLSSCTHYLDGVELMPVDSQRPIGEAAPEELVGPPPGDEDVCGLRNVFAEHAAQHFHGFFLGGGLILLLYSSGLLVGDGGHQDVGSWVLLLKMLRCIMAIGVPHQNPEFDLYRKEGAVPATVGSILSSCWRTGRTLCHLHQAKT